MSDTVSSNDAGYGQQQPSDSSSEFNKLNFLVQQILGTISTMKLVKIVAVTNSGDVSAVGFVDAQPLVNMLDGNNQATQHGTVHHLPYTRIQGGTNAIIMDPKVGDIGWAAISDRDISAVKENKAVSNPGSGRKFDLADGVYIGGILNGVPENFVQFTNDDKINVVAKSDVTVESQTKISFNAPITEVEGALVIGGTVTAKTGSTINFGGTNLSGAGAISGTSVQAGGIDLAGHHHLAPGGNTGPALP